MTNKPDLIDLALGHLTPEDSLRSFEDLDKDGEASNKLELIIDLIRMASQSSNNPFEENHPTKKRYWKSRISRIDELFRSKPSLYPLIGVTSFCIALWFVFAVALYERNKFEDLVAVGRTAFDWKVRGSGDDDLALSYSLFSQGKYRESAGLLARYLKLNDQSESSAYVHYCLGSVYLISSKVTYLSLFTSYDEASVKTGLVELQLAALRSKGGRLKEESRLLRSKGFLMLGLADSALAELDSVQALEGPRKSEAHQMADRVRSILTGSR